MGKMRPGSLLQVIAAAGVILGLSSPAWGEGDKATTKPAAKPAAKAGGDAEFNDACKQGNEKAMAKDLPGAIDLYQKAVKLQPRNPIGYYLLGEAQVLAGNLQEAEKAWLQAEQVADNAPPLVKAKIVFVLAYLRELQKPEEGKPPVEQKKWPDAKAAWQKYGDFAGKHTDIPVYPNSATGRGQAIDDMLKQDQAYVVVRQRIKDEKEHGPQPNVP